MPSLIITGSIARIANSRYISYSEADFEVLGPWLKVRKRLTDIRVVGVNARDERAEGGVMS